MLPIALGRRSISVRVGAGVAVVFALSAFAMTRPAGEYAAAPALSAKQILSAKASAPTTLAPSAAAASDESDTTMLAPGGAASAGRSPARAPSNAAAAVRSSAISGAARSYGERAAAVTGFHKSLGSEPSATAQKTTRGGDCSGQKNGPRCAH